MSILSIFIKFSFWAKQYWVSGFLMASENWTTSNIDINIICHSQKKNRSGDFRGLSQAEYKACVNMFSTDYNGSSNYPCTFLRYNALRPISTQETSDRARLEQN